MHLCNFFAVFQKVLHAAPKSTLQEFFEAVADSELLVSISQQTQVDHGEEIGRLLCAGCPDDYDEVLLRLGSKFECNALRELSGDRVFDVPRFKFDFTVDDVVVFRCATLLQFEWQLWVLKFLQDVTSVEFDRCSINGELYNLLAGGLVGDTQGRAEHLAWEECTVVENLGVNRDYLLHVYNPARR